MLYIVTNTSIGRGVKVESDSPEKALDSVCYYKDWRRVECRVVETNPQKRATAQAREEC